MKHALAWIGIFMCLQLLAGCVGDMSISGAGGQTTNGITMGIVYPDGNPGTCLPVRVRPAGYLANIDGAFSAPPRSVVNGITDEAGVFTVDSIDGGEYVVEVNDGRGFAVAIMCHVPDSGGTVVAGTHTLALTGVVRGHVPPEELNGKSWYLEVYGLERATAVDLQTGAFAFTDMPAGRFTFRRISSNSTIAPIDFSNIQVRSNDTTTIPTYPLWSHNAVLTLNTTSSGAAVSGAVMNFPLLIRLNSANFPFGQAKSDGGDLRFAKSDGTPLPFEIEHWDAGAGLAEVWVKLDTIRGNDSTQSITMYWGNLNAADESNGAAVFDTANGFAGVWHLDTDCSDATAGNNGGTSFGATDTSGIIGGAKKFDGSSYMQVAGLLGAPPSITISAWVRLDSTSGSGQDIVSLGDAVAIRAYRTAPDGTAGFFCSNVSDSDTVHVFTNTGASILKTGWRYLVYTVDVARHVQSMYIDGTFQSSTNDSNPIDYGLGLNTVLGAHGNKKTQSYAFGCIDEARVCRVARSMDWIKLCYMNQKEQDALVKFR